MVVKQVLAGRCSVSRNGQSLCQDISLEGGHYINKRLVNNLLLSDSWVFMLENATVLQRKRKNLFWHSGQIVSTVKTESEIKPMVDLPVWFFCTCIISKINITQHKVGWNIVIYFSYWFSINQYIYQYLLIWAWTWGERNNKLWQWEVMMSPTPYVKLLS